MSLAGSRGAALALVAIGAIGAAIYLPLAIGNRCSSQLTDSMSYLFMADVFSPWTAAQDFAAQMYRASRFPPGFPLVLALFGAGSAALPAVHAIQAVVIVCAAVLGAALALRLCASRIAAVAIGIAFLISPLTVRTALEIGSEALFDLLVAATLLCAAMREPRRADAGDLLPGLLAGLALLTREVGIVLLPALLLWAWDRRSRWAAAGVVLATVEWGAWHALRAGDPQRVTYGASAALAFDGGIGHVASQAPALLASFFAGFVDGSSFSGAPAARIAAALLLLGAAPAWIAGLRRREPLAVFVAGYVAVFSVWPYPGFSTRFAAPLLLPLMILAWRSVAMSRMQGRHAAALATALVLAAPVAGLPRLVSRALESAPDTAYRFEADWFQARTVDDARRGAAVRRKVAAVMESIPGSVAPDARVCALMVEFVTQGAQRRVRAIPPPWEGAVDARWIADSCDYVYLSRFGAPSQGIPSYYPSAAMAQPLRPLIASVIDTGGEPAIVAALVPTAPIDGAPRIVR